MVSALIWGTSYQLQGIGSLILSVRSTRHAIMFQHQTGAQNMRYEGDGASSPPARSAWQTILFQHLIWGTGYELQGDGALSLPAPSDQQAIQSELLGARGLISTRPNSLTLIASANVLKANVLTEVSVRH